MLGRTSAAGLYGRMTCRTVLKGGRSRVNELGVRSPLTWVGRVILSGRRRWVNDQMTIHLTVLAGRIERM